MSCLAPRGLSLAGLLVLTGCAAPTTKPVVLDPGAVAREAQRQQELALQDYLAQQARLSRVSWPILRSGVPMCEDRVRREVGALFVTREDMEDEQAEAAARLLGIDARVRVLLVVEGSPAQAAGLRPGDEVLGFNGAPLPPKTSSGRRFTETMLEQMGDGGQASFLVRRGGEELTLVATPELQCDYPVAVIRDGQVNAYADGESIFVSDGMMRFVETDENLGVVVGHELAHNVMGHISSKQINAGIGLLFDILAAAGGVNTQGAFSNLGAMAYSKEFEAEADYVGLYLTALAGIDVSGAPDLWRRMAVISPENIQTAYGSTHPSHPERFLHLEQTVAEVQAKRRAGLSLVPDAKPSNPQRPQPAKPPGGGIGFGT